MRSSRRGAAARRPPPPRCASTRHPHAVASTPRAETPHGPSSQPSSSLPPAPSHTRPTWNFAATAASNPITMMSTTFSRAAATAAATTVIATRVSMTTARTTALCTATSTAASTGITTPAPASATLATTRRASNAPRTPWTPTADSRCRVTHDCMGVGRASMSCCGCLPSARASKCPSMHKYRNSKAGAARRRCYSLRAGATGPTFSSLSTSLSSGRLAAAAAVVAAAAMAMAAANVTAPAVANRRCRSQPPPLRATRR
mmetsp:Transcript_6504/g.14178  ORF Transcript_6504/g.14178 Transcript_6504/m.14178 type:complete len:259 (+) Transcript_6504:965-1741(+)